MGTDLVLSITHAIEVGLALALLATFCVVVGLLVQHWRKWLINLEKQIDEALDFTGLFPEPKE
jgi:hypothetical protein